MDGHPSGLPQGTGGQNPAYKPTHRRTQPQTAAHEPPPLNLN